MENLYEQKRPEYFSSVRREIIPLVPTYSARALDIGCGEGRTLKWLKDSGRCNEAWGLEFMQPAAKEARRVLDHVIVGDIEEESLELNEAAFDLILCLDVLEHLRDPWSVLKRVSGWLASGGVLVASVPNIRYHSILSNLAFKGRFDYEETGILDKTHLRFFTRKSAVELMLSGGLNDIRLLLHPNRIHGKEAVINALSFGRFRDIFSWQLLLRGTK